MQHVRSQLHWCLNAAAHNCCCCYRRLVSCVEVERMSAARVSYAIFLTQIQANKQQMLLLAHHLGNLPMCSGVLLVLSYCRACC
jgi:hypothetical protein